MFALAVHLRGRSAAGRLLFHSWRRYSCPPALFPFRRVAACFTFCCPLRLALFPDPGLAPVLVLLVRIIRIILGVEARNERQSTEPVSVVIIRFID